MFNFKDVGIVPIRKIAQYSEPIFACVGIEPDRAKSNSVSIESYLNSLGVA